MRNRSLIRHLKLFALAALVLGWWISATVLYATRHQWIVQTFFAWPLISIIVFRFIPNSIVTHPVEAVWIPSPLIQKPFFALPKYIRYGLGWLSLLAIALFVLKSSAGFHMFMWLATLASNFLTKGLVGAAFFFGQETVDTKRWLFVNLLSNVIFSVACVQMLDHQALRLVLLQDYERIWC
ncbi:hypothetical protein BGY98DRAFT_969386 [Russula aff. rugulosa BPL654]|nr:hypothetical protein BGY98DRAFT_969386 [Russula aff. rugulosa BPL654]